LIPTPSQKKIKGQYLDLKKFIDPNRLEAILFDFDGVVVQSEDVYDIATSKLGAFYQREVPPDFFEANRGIADDLFYERFQSELKLDTDIKEITSHGQRILWDEFSSAVDYTPGFQQFFAKVGQLVSKRALVTATPRPLVEKIFSNSKIDVVFDQMITASDVTQTKPHPEPYQKMCALLGVSPKKALVIEDSPTGLRSATLAGCQTVAITTSCTRDSLKEANFVVDSFGELEELLTIV
jgi:beta-phosphoglucomutase-like phosphatase (HAD superfamily)